MSILATYGIAYNLDVAVHEITHVLGIGGPETFVTTEGPSVSPLFRRFALWAMKITARVLYYV
jgi:hypothetical protein